MTMFSYNPLDASSAWPEGDYRATLYAVVEKTSSKGDPMYKITVEAYRGGEKRKVDDYIVNTPASLWKLKKLAKALGAGIEFDAGTFDPSAHTGESLGVFLRIEEQPGFDEKNTIGKYLETAPLPLTPVQEDAAKHAEDPDPDVPF